MQAPQSNSRAHEFRVMDMLHYPESREVEAGQPVETALPTQGNLTFPIHEMSLVEACRWYLHYRHWKQVMAAVGIYGVIFAAWVFMAK